MASQASQQYGRYPANGTPNGPRLSADQERAAAEDEERRQSGRRASTPEDNPAAGNAAAIFSLTTNTILNERHSASRGGIPLGAIVTPLPDFRAPVPVIRRLPASCDNCCSVINPYCKVDPASGSWECLFCGQQCSSQGVLASAPAAQALDELKWEAVDYVTSASKARQPPPPIVALLLDVSAATEDLEPLKAAVMQVVAKIPRRSRIILVAFAAAVSVFRLAEPPEVVAADMFPGHAVPAPEVLEVLTEEARKGGCISPLHSCRPTLEAAIHSLRATEFKGPARERPRCLGAAIFTALHLMAHLGDEQGHPPRTDPHPRQQDMLRGSRGASSGRLLVITTGPTTKGPGYVPVEAIDGVDKGQASRAPEFKQSSKFFAELAAYALDCGIAVDVFAAGMAAVNSPLLSKVATQSGGVLILHQKFGPLFAANAAAALVRRVGFNGVLDIHHTKQLQVTQLIGSVTALDRGPGGMISQGNGSGFLHSNQAAELNVVERGQGIGICLDVSSKMPGPHAHFQVVVSWTAEDGSFVHRVVTRRIDVSPSRVAALQGVDCELSALLLGKRVIQDARDRDAAATPKEAEKLRQSIGQHLAHVAKAYGTAQECPGGWLRRKQRWVLPSNLRFLCEALYQLQRGPMLSTTGGHPDEKALLQGLFINAAPQVALRMLAPALHLLDRGSGQFNIVMPANIALWSDSAAILDHGSHIFIWLGKQVAAGMPDPSGNGSWTRTSVVCERHAMGLAAGRFPVPELLTATEGSSNARYVAARLMPAHRDSLEEQEAQVPLLGALTEEQLAAMLAAQPQTEEASLLQWARSQGVEPPPPPDNVTEALAGMALARGNSMGIPGLKRAQSLAERRRQPSLAVTFGQQ